MQGPFKRHDRISLRLSALTVGWLMGLLFFGAAPGWPARAGQSPPRVYTVQQALDKRADLRNVPIRVQGVLELRRARIRCARGSYCDSRRFSLWDRPRGGPVLKLDNWADGLRPAAGGRVTVTGRLDCSHFMGGLRRATCWLNRVRWLDAQGRPRATRTRGTSITALTATPHAFENVRARVTGEYRPWRKRRCRCRPGRPCRCVIAYLKEGRRWVRLEFAGEVPTVRKGTRISVEGVVVLDTPTRQRTKVRLKKAVVK